MAYIFKTTARIPSRECEGVTFVVRKMTEGRRDELRLAQGPHLAKLGLMQEELTSLVGKTDPESLARSQEIINDSQLVLSALGGVKITWGLKALEGLAEDSDDVTLDIEDWKRWPPELAAEAVRIIDQATGLTVAEVSSLDKGTTSGVVVPEPKPNTTAASASEPDGSSNEIAAPTSPTQ